MFQKGLGYRVRCSFRQNKINARVWILDYASNEDNSWSVTAEPGLMLTAVQGE